MAPAFDPNILFSLLLMILTGGMRDAVSLISTDQYWQAKNVTVSFDQLAHELDPLPPADLTKLVSDLGSPDPTVRETATSRIAEIGLAAAAALRDAANDDSPEVASRARSLLVRIRTESRPAAVRRLMAIRTLGELHDMRALPVLRPLLSSPEMFEAEYAAAVIARLEGKTPVIPIATADQRQADVALLPARLDMIVQIAPGESANYDMEKLSQTLPGGKDRRGRWLSGAVNGWINFLDEVGNFRLDAATWGFFAAPPGQPANNVMILRGSYDSVAFSALLARVSHRTRRVDGVSVFELSDDTAFLVSDNHRLIFLSRESGGELEIEPMLAALRKKSGDLANNADLTNLIKSIDTQKPIWGVAKLSLGLKEVAGPLADFDSATLTGNQLVRDGSLVTEVTLHADSSNAARAQQTIENTRFLLQGIVAAGRPKQEESPYMKTLLDFATTQRIDFKDGAATLTGRFNETALLPQLAVLMILSH